MVNEQFQTIIKQLPEKVCFAENIEWYTNPLKGKTWCKMQDVTNIFEKMPDNAIVGDSLAIEYDNAYEVNRGVTPSVEDYKQLSAVCDIVNVENDDGILLLKEGKYLYLEEGEYWTSSIIYDEVGKPTPIHVKISKGKMHFSTDFVFSAKLNIMPICRKMCSKSKV